MPGLFAKMFNSTSWAADDDRWYGNFLGQDTMAGVKVDQVTALGLPAVWACVRIISEAIASLPLHLYQREARGKTRAMGSPLYRLLHDAPNPEMTALNFRETMAAHILTWGNCYAEKELGPGGVVRALWPITPDRVTAYRDTDTRQIYYKVQMDSVGPSYRLDRGQMLHVAGLGYNGLTGYSPIAKMREAIGMAGALEEFGARFFGQGTNPGLVVSHPARLSPEGSKNLRDSLTAIYSGLGKSHRLMLLEEAMKVEKIGIPPNEAQFIESKRFQLAEIARIYRIPLHLVQEIEKGASYASIEQMSLEFVVYTLRPWLVRFEQAYNSQVLTSEIERKRYFYEHLVDGLLRGDFKSRMEGYNIARIGGWLSANDIRELENMNPIDESKGGEDYWMPANMMVSGEVPEPVIPPDAPALPTPTATPDRDFWRAKYRENPLFAMFLPLFKDVLSQILTREAHLIRKATSVQKTDKGNIGVIDSYPQEMLSYYTSRIAPCYQALMAAAQNRVNDTEFAWECEHFAREHAKNTINYLKNNGDLMVALENNSLRSEHLAPEIIAAMLGRAGGNHERQSH